MTETSDYIITTPRLGMRAWKPEDLELFIQMNMDPDVMRYFPGLMSREQTTTTFKRLVSHQNEHGYCFWATDLLEEQRFIGFIGLVNTRIETPFTPCVEIGWRLMPDAWGKGLATEGAKACLKWAFENRIAEEIYSYTPLTNTPSQRVMQKCGMTSHSTFEHPLLKGHALQEHCVYQIAALTAAQKTNLK